MKYYFLMWFLFQFVLQSGHSQSVVATLEIQLLSKNKIIEHVALIKLTDKSSNETISVLSKPAFIDFQSEIAGVKFRIDRLSDSCFIPIEVTTDISPSDIDTAKTILVKGKGINYSYKLEDIYFLRAGRYRVKSFVLYFADTIPKESETKWEYFEIN